MKVSLDDALNLLNKWKTASSLLYVLLESNAGVSANLFTRIENVLEDEFVLLIPQESPEESQVYVQLQGAEFEYDDSRRVSELLGGIEYESCLTLLTASKSIKISIYVLIEE